MLLVALLAGFILVSSMWGSSMVMPPLLGVLGDGEVELSESLAYRVGVLFEDS